MKNFGEKAILFIMSIALGIIIMSQFNTTQNVLGNENPNEMGAELNNELAKLALEKNELRNEIEKLEKEYEKNEKLLTIKENELKRLEDELNKQKILSGYYDVKGKGAIITINAKPDSYISLAYSHQYILALISYLNNAGVEAISINGQRYTNYTEIVPVLDHINVNGVALVLPLEIKAIGNPRTINSSLNFVGGIVTQIEQLGLTIETEYVDDVFINRYEGEKEFKYASPIAEENIY